MLQDPFFKVGLAVPDKGPAADETGCSAGNSPFAKRDFRDAESFGDLRGSEKSFQEDVSQLSTRAIPVLIGVSN